MTKINELPSASGAAVPLNLDPIEMLRTSTLKQ